MIAHSSPEAFLQFVQQTAPVIEPQLNNSFVPQDSLADCNTYLYKPLHDYTHNAGKRIRPLLCLLGSLAVCNSYKNCIELACSLEHFQTAALIHDDIADESLMRRDKPCMHITEGVGLAINCGDLALVSVIGNLLHTSLVIHPRFVDILRELNSMTTRTIEGQALDLGWARDMRWDITEQDYLHMATLKTAHYSCASPLVLGALHAQANQQTIDHLRAFGIKAGLAFQIQDDMLNLFGSEKLQGKDYRSDITEGKRTFMVVYALNHLACAHKQELIALLCAHTKDAAQLERATELLTLCGAVEYARNYALQLVNQATLHLDQITLAGDVREILLSMACFFVERNK